jgi:ABC-type glycerol-3-phosphate transport system substrate-binding protein
MYIFVIALISFGCCKSKKANSTDKTEVIFWHALGGPLGNALDELVDEFNATHDGIIVNAVSQGNYQALSQKLMASIQADNQPDIGQVYESWTAEMIDGGVIASIDEMIAQDPDFNQDDLDDIYDVFLKSNTIKGGLWSFPFNKSVRVMYYNKDLFFKYGLDPNQPPVSWQDFRNYCKKLTIDDDGDGTPEVYGTNFPVSAWQFENLLLQAGGDILSEDNMRPTFSDEPGLQALNYLNNLLNVDKSAYLSTGYSGQNDFLAGKSAMIEGSSVSMAFMQLNGINFFIGFGPVPVKETKRNIISGTNVAIFKNKDKKVEKAAWEFVKWFTDTKQTAKWSSLTYYMPVRKSAFDEPVLKKRLESNPEIESVYDQLNYATFEPQLKVWYKARKYLEEHVLEKVLRQDLTPEEALKRAEDKISEELKNEYMERSKK